jgi:hypothetical protein
LKHAVFCIKFVYFHIINIMSIDQLKSNVPWYFQPKPYSVQAKTCNSIKLGIMEHQKSKGFKTESDAINDLLATALGLNKK